MKRLIGILVASFFLSVPMLVGQDMDQVEIGAFVDYYRMSDPPPTRNSIGVGGRAAFGNPFNRSD